MRFQHFVDQLHVGTHAMVNCCCMHIEPHLPARTIGAFQSPQAMYRSNKSQCCTPAENLFYGSYIKQLALFQPCMAARYNRRL